MSNQTDSPINVIVALDYSDALIEELRAISPRLNVTRHYPNVPDSAWETAEILYTGSILPTQEQAPNLRWIQLHSAGIDQVIKHPLYANPDIDITNASGIHAVQMAEFTLAMMLAFTFKLPTMLQNQAQAKWETSKNGEQIYNTRELRGQTLGIAGYGSIGRELARIASQMGMKVLASKRNLKVLTEDGYTEPGIGDPNADIPDRLYPDEALASMASVVDFLVLILPNTPSTTHVINESVLNAMKPNAVLINIGRGNAIDEDALVKALTEGKIAGAALDVFQEEPLPSTHPLWKLDNVIISPHISGNSVRYHEKAAQLFITNLEHYLSGNPLLNRVNRDRGY